MLQPYKSPQARQPHPPVTPCPLHRNTSLRSPTKPGVCLFSCLRMAMIGLNFRLTGHARPLINLAARLVKLRDITVTLLTTNQFYDRTVSELERSFVPGEEEFANRMRYASASYERSFFNTISVGNEGSCPLATCRPSPPTASTVFSSQPGRRSPSQRRLYVRRPRLGSTRSRFPKRSSST